jgi:hypothetical protein
MYYTNYHRTNQNVEACKIKRKEKPIPIVSEVTIQHIRIQIPMRYSCHICGEIRHKIINCPKFNDMQNMFKNKGVEAIEKPSMVEPKVVNPSIHVMDVNMAIAKNKVIEEQVFKDKKPIKKKFVDD